MPTWPECDWSGSFTRRPRSAGSHVRAQQLPVTPLYLHSRMSDFQSETRFGFRGTWATRIHVFFYSDRSTLAVAVRARGEGGHIKYSGSERVYWPRNVVATIWAHRWIQEDSGYNIQTVPVRSAHSCSFNTLRPERGRSQTFILLSAVPRAQLCPTGARILCLCPFFRTEYLLNG